MKVLVATKETQGRRANDFCWAHEGELVMYPSECSREEVDGRCGCRRAMAGTRSLKSTTTMKVAETDFTVADLEVEVRAALDKGGWLGFGGDRMVDAMMADMWQVVRFAAKLPVGMVVERRGAFQVRK